MGASRKQDGAKWLWWAGTAETVDDDATYDLGCFATRDDAIRSALRDTCPGDTFCIVEALTSEREEDRDEDDRIPFVAARNAERLVNGEEATIPFNSKGQQQ